MSSAGLRWCFGAAIAALTWVGYAGVVDAPFAYDDVSSIVGNRGIRAEAGWGSLSLWSPTPRPVANASFALNYAWGGLSVRGYRVVNVWIHVLCAWAVMALVFRLQRAWSRLPGQGGAVPGAREALWLAGFSGLLFAVHPVQTQAVTYVVQRMTSLASLFYVVGVWSYVRGRETRGGARIGWWTATGVLGVLALGTKEIAVTYPLALLGVEWLFYRDLDREWGWRAAGVSGFALGAAVLGWWGLGGADPFAGYADKSFGMWERLWTESRVVWGYAGLVGWPWPGRLSLIHAVEVSSSPWWPPVTLLALGAWAALGWGCVRFGRRWRWLLFGVGWWCLHHGVESTVLPLELVYEHRVYLPLVGVVAVVPWALWWGCRGRGGWALGVGCALVGALLVATAVRNPVWNDPLVLWSDALQKAPRHPRPHNNLAMELAARGRLHEALAHYDSAVALAPDFQEPHHNRAIVLYQLGRPEEARASFERALALQPRDPAAHAAFARLLVDEGELDAAGAHLVAAYEFSRDMQRLYELAGVRRLQGRLDEARALLLRLRERYPEEAELVGELGVVDALRGELDLAIEELRLAVRLGPSANARLQLGRALWAAGRWGAALAELEAAAHSAPEAARITASLAWARAVAPDPELRDPRGARELAMRALERKPEDPEALDALAAALAGQRSFQEAVFAAERAASAAEERGRGARARAIRERRRLYARGSAFVEDRASAAEHTDYWWARPTGGGP